jgi:hypothetical protein
MVDCASTAIQMQICLLRGIVLRFRHISKLRHLDSVYTRTRAGRGGEREDIKDPDFLNNAVARPLAVKNMQKV